MDEKINTIIESLRSCGLNDIKKASGGGAKMGAFILCSCLIESVAGFMKGTDTCRSDYKDFVKIYLPAYDKEKLYTDLRCKLVHSYSEGGSYLFTDNNPSSHLRQSEHNKIIINLENLINDIEQVLNAYVTKLQDPTEVDLRNKAVQRYDSNGIIQVYDTTSPSLSGSNIQGAGV